MAEGRYRWIVNNWVHDVATGLWVAGLFVVWRLAGLRPVTGSGEMLTEVASEMYWVMIGSLVVIFVTGAIRLRYWRNQGTADELPYRRRSLLVKHAVYLAVYGAGTVWAYFLLH